MCLSDDTYHEGLSGRRIAMTSGGDGPAAGAPRAILIRRRAGQFVTIRVPYPAITFREGCAFVTHDNEEYRVQVSLMGLVGVHEFAVAVPRRMWLHYRRGGELPDDLVNFIRTHHARLAELHEVGSRLAQ